MNDDRNVVMTTGSEDELGTSRAAKLEGLNTLLDSATAALAGGVLGDLDSGERRECMERAVRLKTELGHALRDLEDVPLLQTVRVRGLDGLDARYSLQFPLYARGYGESLRMIDGDMLEVEILAVGSPTFECRITRKRVDFLDGKGVDYWLGRGVHEASQQEFDALMKRVRDRILPLMGE